MYPTFTAYDYMNIVSGSKNSEFDFIQSEILGKCSKQNIFKNLKEHGKKTVIVGDNFMIG